MVNEYIDKETLATLKQVEENKIKKQRASKERKPKGKPNVLLQILNGEILTKDLVLNNLVYVFFCVFLLILIVGKVHYGNQLTKDIDASLKKLDASTAEYVEAKASLEEKTKRIELLQKLEPKGLKETTKPAKVIRIKVKKK
jgi:hypothetical protein